MGGAHPTWLLWRLERYTVNMGFKRFVVFDEGVFLVVNGWVFAIFE